ncbi:hypothetical protein [Vulgatibacter sp.]|uniref:hypothetical protein n=1 Tax=Vulgatibacter sp. TaxID=1971226 RepID=UPI003564F6D6
MTLPFAVRLRAHSAGMEELAHRVLAGGRDAADLLALAHGPLPVLGTLVAAVAPKEAAVVGLLPVRLGADVAETVEKALAHRAAAEAEVIDLAATAPCTTGALDQACEVVRRLLAQLPGATARIDEASLHALAAGAGIGPDGAAARLAQAGFSLVTAARIPGALQLASEGTGSLPVRESWEVPSQIDERFVQALLAGPRRPLFLKASRDTTGIVLLRAVALARLAGHGPIAVGGEDELKGPDACLSYGADTLEAALDPAGAMGSRTRSYGEAAVRGAQLALLPPKRRMAPGKKAAHILDEKVDASLLPGGDAEEIH